MNLKQQLFTEMNEHLLYDEEPSVYFDGIQDEIFYNEFPFAFLSNLKEIQQSPEHHPEGSVWNHTMLVINEAAKVKFKSKNEKAFMWAALLHDIGKADTTKNKKGKITAYDHDKLGAEQSVQFLKEFSEDDIFIDKVSALVRWHMQILFIVKSMQFADISAMKKSVEMNEMALLGYCDRMGRLGADHHKEEENIKIFLQKCRAFPR